MMVRGYENLRKYQEKQKKEKGLRAPPQAFFTYPSEPQKTLNPAWLRNKLSTSADSSGPIR